MWLCCVLLLIAGQASAYTRQDSLRGSNGRGRDWWDVVKYDVDVELNADSQTISGACYITLKVIEEPKDSLQIDLQDGISLDEVHPVGSVTVREGNVYWIKPSSFWKKGNLCILSLKFHGRPRKAVNPPWDGGLIWSRDSLGFDWIAVACQGLGASSWWPCKDYQGDEPDSGTVITIAGKLERHYALNGKRPTYSIVTNGRPTPVQRGLAIRTDDRPLRSFYVRNPINTYDVSFYIGDYAHWHDTLHGEKGILDLDFYPLRYNEAKARKQWTQAKEMLRCFEYWMGPYPFYEDGYKLVEAPYLGMEHQSAIAYGNNYKNGYNRLGTPIDRSGTGVGFSFDFIIIHESGHEWFGNSITAQDIADNWLHEGFTTYTETLFAEWIKGKDSAFAYAQGEWRNIKNDRPVIGDYGVNNEGSTDMYDKGAAVVHMIRMMLNDDKKFRELLRGLNRDFYHKIVTSKEVEDYISRFVGKDLKPFFDQYLRTTNKPILEWYVAGKEIHYQWKNTVAGFVAPIRVQLRYRHTDKISADHPSYYSFEGVEPSEASIQPIGWYDVVQKK